MASERCFLQGRAEDHWRGNTRKVTVYYVVAYLLRGILKRKKKEVLHSTFDFGNPTELTANE